MQDNNKDIDKPANSPEDDLSHSPPEEHKNKKKAKIISMKQLRKMARKELIRRKAAERKEEEFWIEVKDRNEEEGYVEYLEKYPDGKYSLQANSEIYYRFIKMGPLTVEECTTYLDRYPDEKYAPEIRERLNKLRRKELRKKINIVVLIGVIFIAVYLYILKNTPRVRQDRQKQVIQKNSQ